MIWCGERQKPPLLVRYLPLKIQSYLPLTSPPHQPQGGKQKGKEELKFLPPDN